MCLAIDSEVCVRVWEAFSLHPSKMFPNLMDLSIDLPVPAPSSHTEHGPQQKPVLFVRKHLPEVRGAGRLQRLVGVEERLGEPVQLLSGAAGLCGPVLPHLTRLPVGQRRLLVRVSAGGFQQQGQYHRDG